MSNFSRRQSKIGIDSGIHERIIYPHRQVLDLNLELERGDLCAGKV